MSNNPSRASVYPKAPATSTSPIITLSHDSPASAALTSQPRTALNDDKDAPVDKSTIALIRRVLCPQANIYGTATPRPLQELLPPLTSSNEVDLQLYAIIAIIIKEYVYAWYAKITIDHGFVDEVLRTVAHCTLALEERLRRIDVQQLVLDELPRLVEAHIISYRMARQGSDLVTFPSSMRVIYHTLNPHPGLSPPPDPSDSQTIRKQLENEVVYRRLLAQGTLAVILPTEDLENSCLRTLVGDVLADLILGDEIGGKACEGWFVWAAVSRLISVVKHDTQNNETDGEETQDIRRSRLERFGLLSPKKGLSSSDLSSHNQSPTSIWVWRILQGAYLVCIGIWFLLMGLLRTALPMSAGEIVSSPITPSPINRANEAPSWAAKTATRRPILDYKLFGMMSQLLDVPRRMPWLEGMLSLLRYGLLMGPGKLGETDRILDRLLHAAIQGYVFTPTFLPALLFRVRSMLFPMNARPNPIPNSHPAPPSAPRSARPNEQAPRTADSGPDAARIGNFSPGGTSSSPMPLPLPEAQRQKPSDSEIAAIKRECAASILSLIPRPMAQTFFRVSPNDMIATPSGPQGESRSDTRPVSDTKDNQEEGSISPSKSDDLAEILLLSAIEDSVLDVFADEYCNKHLLYSIVETVLVRLFPELSEHGVAELMEERGVVSLT